MCETASFISEFYLGMTTREIASLIREFYLSMAVYVRQQV